MFSRIQLNFAIRKISPIFAMLSTFFQTILVSTRTYVSDHKEVFLQ